MKSEVSAFMDGAIDAPGASTILDLLEKSPELREDWETWHFIGDVLRVQTEKPGAPEALSADFSHRFMEVLADEPPIFPPGAVFRQGRSVMAYAMVALMGIGTVTGVAWSLGIIGAGRDASPAGASPLPAEIARADPGEKGAVSGDPVVPGMAGAARSVAFDPGSARDYLVAHGSHGSGTLIQGMARYQRGMSEPAQGGAR